MTYIKLIEKYAYDYRGMKMSEDELIEMLCSFLKEYEKGKRDFKRRINLKQVGNRMAGEPFPSAYDIEDKINEIIDKINEIIDMTEKAKK